MAISVVDRPLLHIEKVKVNQQAFEKKVRQIAYDLAIEPDWLMVVMDFETSGTFSPSIKNPHSSATGLIQFMDSTAKGLGTTTAALAQMSNVQQLDYVKKYYQGVIQRHGTIDNVGEAYLAVFYPAAISWDIQKVFPYSVFKVNQVFDRNKDGTISKQEILDTILLRIPAMFRDTVGAKKKYNEPDSFRDRSSDVTERVIPGSNLQKVQRIKYWLFEFFDKLKPSKNEDH